MSSEFDAIYERGIFRPLGPVDLPEHTKVHLQVDPVEANVAASFPPADVAVQRTAVVRMLGWLNQQPATNESGDALGQGPVSARSHDQILYGWPK